MWCFHPWPLCGNATQLNSLSGLSDWQGMKVLQWFALHWKEPLSIPIFLSMSQYLPIINIIRSLPVIVCLGLCWEYYFFKTYLCSILPSQQNQRNISSGSNWFWGLCMFARTLASQPQKILPVFSSLTLAQSSMFAQIVKKNILFQNPTKFWKWI